MLLDQLLLTPIMTAGGGLGVLGGCWWVAGCLVGCTAGWLVSRLDGVLLQPGTPKCLFYSTIRDAPVACCPPPCRSVLCCPEADGGAAGGHPALLPGKPPVLLLSVPATQEPHALSQPASGQPAPAAPGCRAHQPLLSPPPHPHPPPPPHTPPTHPPTPHTHPPTPPSAPPRSPILLHTHPATICPPLFSPPAAGQVSWHAARRLRSVGALQLRRIPLHPTGPAPAGGQPCGHRLGHLCLRIMHQLPRLQRRQQQRRGSRHGRPAGGVLRGICCHGGKRGAVPGWQLRQYTVLLRISKQPLPPREPPQIMMRSQ